MQSLVLMGHSNFKKNLSVCCGCTIACPRFFSIFFESVDPEVSMKNSAVFKLKFVTNISKFAVLLHSLSKIACISLI